jgi:hypothetical protein
LITDRFNGGSGTVDYFPFVVAVAAVLTPPDPVSGAVTEIEVTVRTSDLSIFFADGPGSSLAPAPFRFSTTNGTLTSDSEGPAQDLGAALSGGVVHLEWTPQFAGISELSASGPCGLDGSISVMVAQGGEPGIWGDDNCDGSANPVDSLLTLRFDAGLSTSTCRPMGLVVEVASASPHPWGDVDCSGTVDPVDSLKLLRFDAGLSVSQEPGCPQVGAAILVTDLPAP